MSVFRAFPAALGVRHPQSGSRRSARSAARTNGLDAGEDGAMLAAVGDEQVSPVCGCRLWHRKGGRLGVSRSGDRAWPVIVTVRAFVILPLFCSRVCPRWSSTSSTTPAPSCGCVLARRPPRGCARAAVARHDECTPGTLRRLTDLPVAGRSVVVELHVRRLVCQDASVRSARSVEQVPELAARYARRTQRLTATVGRLAVTLGRSGRRRRAGRAGSGLISRSTVLRVLMALPLPPAADSAGAQRG